MHCRRTLLPLSAAGLLATCTGAWAASIDCTASSYTARTLAGGAVTLPSVPVLRFAQLSDVHIFDDDGSPAFNGSELEPALEPTIGNGSAQRLQDEYTDEVLNAMVSTINTCNARSPIELMIATGDNIDTMTLNELRRYIDNLDGVSGADTAYEANCGYTTRDSNGNAKLGAAPCTADMQAAFAVPTGKLVADSQSNPPEPGRPADQFMPTRSPRQNAGTIASSAAGLSYTVAPGLPPVLRCNDGEADCTNHKLAVPYYAVFGNHDGSVRGTVTMQRPFQAGTAPHGRYFFQSQREWINEFFYTTESPGPSGHGFRYAGARLADADDRNDGYYAFDAGANGAVRMIVLNTLYDGVRNEVHRRGQTGADTQGVVAGNEVSNPIGLEQGVLSTEQYDWLAGELAAAAAAGKAALVFSHHPDRSFSDRRLGFAADGGKTSLEFDALLGRADFGGNPSTLVAHIAGHTHENIIRPCAPGSCEVGAGGPQATVGHSFWRVETASLIDYPQEGRIIEVYSLGNRRYALRLTMLSPDPNDGVAALSHRLSIAEATCNVSQMLGGPASSGPYDQARLETVVSNAGEAAVRQKFCFGEASLAAAEGAPTDRNVVLYP